MLLTIRILKNKILPNFNDIDNFLYFVRYSPYINHRTVLAKEKSAIAYDYKKIRKEMPITTAIDGVWLICHMICFFMLSKNKTIFFVCSDISFEMGLSRKSNH